MLLIENQSVTLYIGNLILDTIGSIRIVNGYELLCSCRQCTMDNQRYQDDLWPDQTNIYHYLEHSIGKKTQLQRKSQNMLIIWKKIDILTNLFNNKFLLLLTANAFRLSET